MAVSNQLAGASLLDALREATRAEHRQLEQTPVMAQLLAPDLSVAGYCKVLRLFADFYAAVDPLLEKFTVGSGLQPVNYRYQARLPVLYRTLAALNDHYTARPCQLAPAQNHAALLGCAYVVEGASQGGRVIYPRIKKRLALADESLHFFAHFGYHADGWSQLQPLLAQTYHDTEHTQACQAARSLFNALTALAQPSTHAHQLATDKDIFAL